MLCLVLYLNKAELAYGDTLFETMLRVDSRIFSEGLTVGVLSSSEIDCLLLWALFSSGKKRSDLMVTPSMPVYLREPRFYIGASIKP